MRFTKILYSTKGIVSLFLLLILINAAIMKVNIRMDMTEDRLYSLSKGTTDILNGVKNNIEIKLFYSKDSKNIPLFFKNYTQRVVDFLKEYEHFSKGKIKLEIYNPVNDSSEEDLAGKYRIQKINITSDDSIYFGLAIVLGNKEEVIPFLDPAKEKLLEYDLTRAINMVAASVKKKIGIISSIPVFGVSPISFNMTAAPEASEWYFIKELKKTYNVIEIDPYGDTFDANLDLLILIHPKKLSEQLNYSIDQYILSGKNALIFIDPFSILDNQRGEIRASSFDKFFSTWKIKADMSKLLVDFSFSTQVMSENGFAESNPYFISARARAFNPNSIITSQLERIMMPFAGAIFKESNCPYEFEPLIKSSTNSNLDANFTDNFQIDAIQKTFKPSNKSYNLAVKLSGKFDTAFPEGKPVKKEDANKTKETDNQNTDTKVSLKKGTKASTIIIAADTDMLYDDYYMKKENVLGFDIAQIFNDNLNFLSNSVELLTGSEALISIRTIGKFERPFIKVTDLEDKARRKWFASEQELIRRAEDANAKLRMLEKGKEANITEEQENEIKKFHEEKIKIKEELKIVRRNLKADIEELGEIIKFFNIIFIPIMIFVVWLIFIVYRHRRLRNDS